ncbi:MAG: hypothetical protein U0744_05120 [Gemmataceae bacterium]
MLETVLKLDATEREFLVSLLKNALKDARIEEHRTRTPSFREFVLERETLLTHVLAKLGAPVDKNVSLGAG